MADARLALLMDAANADSSVRNIARLSFDRLETYIRAPSSKSEKTRAQSW